MTGSNCFQRAVVTLASASTMPLMEDLHDDICPTICMLPMIRVTDVRVTEESGLHNSGRTRFT